MTRAVLDGSNTGARALVVADAALARVSWADAGDRAGGREPGRTVGVTDGAGPAGVVEGPGGRSGVPVPRRDAVPLDGR